MHQNGFTFPNYWAIHSPMFPTIHLFLGDHLGVDKKKSGDHFGVGIISGSIWGSFQGWGSFRGRDHFRGCTESIILNDVMNLTIIVHTMKPFLSLTQFSWTLLLQLQSFSFGCAFSVVYIRFSCFPSEVNSALLLTEDQPLLCGSSTLFHHVLLCNRETPELSLYKV